MRFPFGNSPGQTGYVLGWRTYKKNNINFLVRIENGNSLCVNPISWTTDNSWTPKEKHKEALGRDFNKLISGGVRAAVAPNANILWVDLPAGTEEATGMARLNNLHIADYNLFWMDIRENVKERIRSYLAK